MLTVDEQLEQALAKIKSLEADAAASADLLSEAEIKCSSSILEYLPPYSPDLNPIERKWAQAKARRRNLKCSIPSLFSDSYL